MVLILRWNMCDQVLVEMKDKCYGADERPAHRGQLTVFEQIIMASPRRGNRPSQTAQNMEFIGSIHSHGIK